MTNSAAQFGQNKQEDVKEVKESVLSKDLGALTSGCTTAHREYQIFTKYEDPDIYSGPKFSEIVS